MNILVCLDENYLPPLRTMLLSLFENNPLNEFTVFIMHSRIRDEEIEKLEKFVKKASNSRAKLVNLKITEEFDKSATTFYYTQEMYYRLLAYKYLPKEVDRILYLDPDILVLNKVDKLYNIDFEGNLFAAATHTTPPVQFSNKVRLSVVSDLEEPINYYNSGVLMLNVSLQRQVVDEKEITDYVSNAKKLALIMPDQDLLNVVFQDKIKQVSELKYNYDARRFSIYKMMYDYCDLDYVIENTVFLHFCGKQKPRLNKYNGKFESIYMYFRIKAKKLSEEKI